MAGGTPASCPIGADQQYGQEAAKYLKGPRASLAWLLQAEVRTLEEDVWGRKPFEGFAPTGPA